jgi:hypothetical protein
MVKRITPETGNVGGRITDKASGKPLFGVSLTVAASGLQATTDVRGRFFIPNVPAGECTMNCEQPGFKPISGMKVTVKPGETTQQDCALTCKNRTPLNDPVVLLPLRLEIHKVTPQVGQTIFVANYLASTPTIAASFAQQRFEPLLLRSEIQQRVVQTSQYWIRWYPDIVHHLPPVGRITDVEKTAWADFIAIYEKHKDKGTVKGLYTQSPYSLSLDTLGVYYGTGPGRLSDDELGRCKAYDNAALELIRSEGLGVREALAWRDLENAELKAAWIVFAKTVGPIRARQIVKHLLDGDWDFDTDPELEDEPLDILVNRGMPLPSLPEEVSLYTINNRQATLLIEGIEIDRNELFVAPTDFAGSLWMTDFQKAVAAGMGVVVSDPAKVQQIDQAEWLIAVGINQTDDSRKVLENVLRRNNAKGEVCFLAQDSPTNNMDAASTLYSDLESNPESYLRNTYMRLSGADSAPDLPSQLAQNRTDSQRLQHILKLANPTLSEIIGADFAELSEAAAMAELLWTPSTWHYQQLYGGFCNQYFPVMSRFLSNLKMGDFFVNNVRARGTLPIIRIEDNPYGILPVISLRDWSKNLSRNAQISATDADGIFAFVDSLKQRFLALAQHGPKLDITTGDAQYDTLVEILKSAPVAKRVDVRPFDPQTPGDLSENPKYLNCALVRDKTNGALPSTEVPYPETAYLNDFSKVNQPGFDPASFQIDGDSPLLKRILKYLLGLIFVSPPPPPPTRPDVTPPLDKSAGKVQLNRPAATLRINPNAGTFEPAAPKGGVFEPGGPKGGVFEPGGPKGGGVFDPGPVIVFPTGTTPSVPQVPGGANLLAEAASLLKRVHPDKLEILLLETLDLFSHRLDAWFSGLANSILEQAQLQNKQSPPIGLYGWLEKPGQLPPRSIAPEFIQAPSVKQATTAAILRNASLHNGTNDNGGAFQINLSSEQIRKGTWYMDGLRQGHLPGELLGYRLERMIHEESRKPNSQIQDIDAFDLRDLYPLPIQETKDADGKSTATLTIIDGEKFLNDPNTPPRFNKLKSELNRIKDAAADIALCEVIDANDNVARQGGWMDFLDGDALPPREEFIRTQRTGDVHGTKLFLPLHSLTQLEAAPGETNPRVIAEPLLAEFCESLMPDFGVKEIVADLTKIDGTHTRPITFQVRELNLQPLDLVVGGFEELKLRARYHLLTCWNDNDPNDLTASSPCNILGPFPDFEKSDDLLNEVGIEIIPPASAADKLSIFSYVEKATLIRRLIHQNQTKNGLGTVSPEDLPLISEDQVDQVDQLAGFELLTKRQRRLRDRLVGLLSVAVGATIKLRKGHIALRVLQDVQTLLAKTRGELAGDTATVATETINQLKAKVTNLIDTDSDLGALAVSLSVMGQIDQLSNADVKPSEVIDKLLEHFVDLEKRATVLIQQSAESLVRDPELQLVEISKFGLEQALTVFPQAPTVGASAKILKLFEQLVTALSDKLLPLVDAAQYRDAIQCLKVLYTHAEEANEILSANPNATDAIAQLRNRLPLSDAQLQMIGSLQFKSASYFEPLINEFRNKLNALSQISTLYEGLVSSLQTTIQAGAADARAQALSTIRAKTSEVITLLQSATDKEGMVVLTPYLLRAEGGKRPEWNIDLSQLGELNGPAYLPEYRNLRPAIANVLTLFDLGRDLKIFEDKREQRIDAADATVKKQGNTDFLYLAPNEDALKNTSSLTVLLLDQWQEGIPNPDESEVTGVALQFDSPQSEAPNAILIAVPPYLGSGDFWNPDLLANTLLETIELMQIRLVGSDEVRSDFLLNWLFHLPMTFFPPGKDGARLFPVREQLFHVFDVGTLSGYVLASKLSSTDLSGTTATFNRADTPKIGGDQ